VAAEDTEVSDFPNPFATAYETEQEQRSQPALPCVGCGWCCLHAPCETSHRKYGYRTRCPDLLWDETQRRYLCLLMLAPKTRETTRREQSEGRGCCAPTNPWREDVRNRDVPGNTKPTGQAEPQPPGKKSATEIL
jgi:hypothetical protein